MTRLQNRLLLKSRIYGVCEGDIFGVGVGSDGFAGVSVGAGVGVGSDGLVGDG